jgi:hypothetical protein
VTEPPPAELLARLKPIPTYRDHPASVAHDVSGQAPDGTPRTIAVRQSPAPVLLLFLSTGCLGCQDLWEGTDELRRALPDEVQAVLVTHGPAQEDAVAVARLADERADVVMSSQAFTDYRVAGPPFLVVVAGGQVRTEGVAWGTGETVRATRSALGLSC